jgi:hypothetical protein
MSLFDSASLVVTPNGVKEGKIYSIKPSDGSGDLSVTRATTATRVNSAGLVEVVPYNLAKYSEQFDNGDWVKNDSVVTANATIAPNGTTTADSLANTTSNSTHRFYQPISANLGNPQTIIFSIYLKYNNHRYFSFGLTDDSDYRSQVVVDLQNGVITENYVRISGETLTSTITNEGNGWYKVTGTFTYTTALAGNSGYLLGLLLNQSTFTSSSYSGTGTSIYLWGVQLIQGSSAKDYFPTTNRLNIPRLDYTNGTCPSLLVEPQRTNVLAYSNNFTLGGGNWFNISGANPIANQGISPDGINNAWTLPSNSTLTTEFGKTIGQAIGDKVTASIYAKGSETAFNVYIQNVINTDILGTVTVNLTTGLITSGSGNVQNMGNGWYRISVTGTSTITNGYARPIFKNPNSACLIYGAQYEAGSYATSYIPTTSASVTRNADVISKTGISSLIGQTEGTVLIDINYKVINETSMFFSVRPSASNKIEIYRDSQTIYGEIVGNSVSISLSKSSSPSGTYKIALAYKSGETVLYVNGTNVGTSTTAFSFSTSMADLFLGSRSGGTLIEQGFFNQATIWKERLTNDQLAQLTTI